MAYKALLVELVSQPKRWSVHWYRDAASMPISCGTI